MGGQVVHDGRVAGLKGGGEYVCDAGAEALLFIAPSSNPGAVRPLPRRPGCSVTGSRVINGVLHMLMKVSDIGRTKTVLGKKMSHALHNEN